MQNLMIAIMRRKKQSLNLTITMEMQKREKSWMVAKKKEEGKDATYRLQGKDGCEVDC